MVMGKKIKENKGKNICHHSNPSISAGLTNWGYS